MAKENEIVLDVKINTEEVATKLAAATKALAEHKQQQKELKKAIEESNGTNAIAAKMYADVSAQIEQESRAVKSNTALLQAETLARVDDTMSLDEQRQALNAAQKAYASLSGEAKAVADAEGGLRDQINALSDSVKKQEAAIGDNRRNVGNYADSIKEAASGMGVLGQGIAGATQKMQQAKSVMTVIAAHPLIAILGALVLIFKKIGEAIKGNAAAMESLTSVFGAFSGVTNIVNTIIEKIADGLGWIAEKALQLADKLGILSDKVKEGQAIAKEDLAIQKAQREAALATAEDQKKIANLRAQAADKNKYSAEERIKLLKQANDLEAGISKRQYDLAKREYDLQVKKNAQSKSSQEDLKKENDLKIKMIEAETAYFNKQKELNAQLSSAQNQMASEAAAEAAEQAKIAEEAAKKLQDIRDKMLARSRSDLENAIADLEAKKEQELAIEGLTAEERLQIEQYYNEQVQQLREADALAAMEAERKKLQAKQDARIEFGLDPEKSEEEIMLEKAQAAYEQGLLDTEEYEQAKTEITARFAQERADKIKEERAEMQAQFQAEMKTALSTATNSANAMASALESFADSNEDAAKAQKAFALIGILTNQAQSISEGALAIAKGVESAAAIPFPANIPAIISITAQIGAMVAGVMTSIAQAKQLFSEAETQKFATGGIVGGTSYTGDQVPVMANSREMILNTDQQTRLFDALDGGGGQLGFNYEAMAAAVAALPAPVMVYSEFNEFQDNVATFNEIAAV